MPGRCYTTNATQQIVIQLGNRIRSLNWQLGRAQLQNAPQVSEIANLQQAIVDATNALTVAQNVR